MRSTHAVYARRATATRSRRKLNVVGGADRGGPVLEAERRISGRAIVFSGASGYPPNETRRLAREPDPARRAPAMQRPSCGSSARPRPPAPLRRAAGRACHRLRHRCAAVLERLPWSQPGAFRIGVQGKVLEALAMQVPVVHARSRRLAHRGRRRTTARSSHRRGVVRSGFGRSPGDRGTRRVAVGDGAPLCRGTFHLECERREARSHPATRRPEPDRHGSRSMKGAIRRCAPLTSSREWSRKCW